MLDKAYRLTKRGSFDYIYKNGKKWYFDVLYLVYLVGKNTKIGFSISKSIGKAHTRNLIKRRMRAIVRELLPEFKIKAQLVIVARRGVELLTYEELKTTLIKLLTKTRFIC